MAIGWTSKIILAFVTLIIGLVLIGSVSTETIKKTDAEYQINASVDVSDARWNGASSHKKGAHMNSSYVLDLDAECANCNFGDTNKDCPLTNFELRNYTNGTAVSTTKYNISYGPTGKAYLQMANRSVQQSSASSLSNTTWVRYNYCGVGYMNTAFGRTALDLAPAFFGLALLLASVGLFFNVYQDFKNE